MKAIDVKEAGETFTAAYQNAARGVRNLQHSAEDTIEETRHTIKAHPLATTFGAAAAGMVVGIVMGWFLGRRS